MQLLNRILLPIDFSSAAEDALHTSIRLAQRFNSEIILLHVITDTEERNQELHHTEEVIKDKLSAVHKQIESQGLRTQEPLITTGVPCDQIVWLANSLDVNVIVLGAKGESNEANQAIGLTVTKVIHKASKPVWVVKEGKPQKIKRILCPTDFSDPANRALGNAIHMARDFNAELQVLHVVQPDSPIYQPARANIQQQELTTEEQEHFDRIFRTFDLSDINLSKTIRQGKPHEQILEEVRQTRADLIVMGTVGRTGLARFFMGSVTEKITRQLPCSMVTLKAEDAIRLQLETNLADTEARYKLGCELLSEGYPQEAIVQLEACVDKDMMFAEAWEALAEAHEHLGHVEKPRQFRERAHMVRRRIEDRKLEAAIRREVWSTKNKFSKA